MASEHTQASYWRRWLRVLIALLILLSVISELIVTTIGHEQLGQLESAAIAAEVALEELSPLAIIQSLRECYYVPALRPGRRMFEGNMDCDSISNPGFSLDGLRDEYILQQLKENRTKEFCRLYPRQCWEVQLESLIIVASRVKLAWDKSRAATLVVGASLLLGCALFAAMRYWMTVKSIGYLVGILVLLPVAAAQFVWSVPGGSIIAPIVIISGVIGLPLKWLLWVLVNAFGAAAGFVLFLTSPSVFASAVGLLVGWRHAKHSAAELKDSIAAATVGRIPSSTSKLSDKQRRANSAE